MTVMEFFGCTFIAFGPPLALFIFTIAKDPIRIIILIAGAFFWLLSLLLSSILWFAVYPLRKELAFGLFFSVVFQELFRFAYYKLLRKAEVGLQKVTETGYSAEARGRVSNSRHTLAYVSGFGFGIMSGVFSLVNVLADSIGPGTVGLKGNSDYFFFVSALLTLSFIFLHIFWGVIFFHACDILSYWRIAIVVGSHLFVSCMTLLNKQASLNNQTIYILPILSAYIMTILMAILAFFSAGGSIKKIQTSDPAFVNDQPNSDMNGYN